ncbi:hypothetical protein B0H13DRAFT_1897279 [Mycena leptocephala]|nr:hypothetical protein B0H13DRAFT_1897279 [Mycena leptocephala]
MSWNCLQLALEHREGRNRPAPATLVPYRPVSAFAGLPRRVPPLHQFRSSDELPSSVPFIGTSPSLLHVGSCLRCLIHQTTTTPSIILHDISGRVAMTLRRPSMLSSAPIFVFIMDVPANGSIVEAIQNHCHTKNIDYAAPTPIYEITMLWTGFLINSPRRPVEMIRQKTSNEVAPITSAPNRSAMTGKRDGHRRNASHLLLPTISGHSAGYPSLQQNFNPVQALSNSQNFLQPATSQEHCSRRMRMSNAVLTRARTQMGRPLPLPLVHGSLWINNHQILWRPPEAGGAPQTFVAGWGVFSARAWFDSTHAGDVPCVCAFLADDGWMATSSPPSSPPSATIPSTPRPGSSRSPSMAPTSLCASSAGGSWWGGWRVGRGGVSLIHIPQALTGCHAGQHLQGGEERRLRGGSEIPRRSQSMVCRSSARIVPFLFPDSVPQTCWRDGLRDRYISSRLLVPKLLTNLHLLPLTGPDGAPIGMLLAARACGDWSRALHTFALTPDFGDAYLEDVKEDPEQQEKERDLEAAANGITYEKREFPVPANAAVPPQKNAGGEDPLPGRSAYLILEGLYGGPTLRAGDFELVWCWCVRSFGAINWFAPYLLQITTLAARPDSGLDLRIRIFVTCLCDPSAVPHIPGCTVTEARPSVGAVLDRLLDPVAARSEQFPNWPSRMAQSIVSNALQMDNW